MNMINKMMMMSQNKIKMKKFNKKWSINIKKFNKLFILNLASGVSIKLKN